MLINQSAVISLGINRKLGITFLWKKVKYVWTLSSSNSRRTENDGLIQKWTPQVPHNSSSGDALVFFLGTCSYASLTGVTWGAMLSPARSLSAAGTQNVGFRTLTTLYQIAAPSGTSLVLLINFFSVLIFAAGSLLA